MVQVHMNSENQNPYCFGCCFFLKHTGEVEKGSNNFIFIYSISLESPSEQEPNWQKYWHFLRKHAP